MTFTCRKDGDSCLAIITKERAEYAAKGGIFSEAYIGGMAVDRIKSLQVFKGKNRCSVSVFGRGGDALLFEDPFEYEALEIGELPGDLAQLNQLGGQLSTGIVWE